MAEIHDVITFFHELTDEQQNELLGDLYNYSNDIKLFLESRLGLEVNVEGLIKEMERETTNKIYRKGVPSTPDGRKVNAILAKARKAHIDIPTLLTLEQLAYRGFIEFLNEYGGGPDNFDEMACRHLEAYLTLVKMHIHDKTEQERL